MASNRANNPQNRMGVITGMGYRYGTDIHYTYVHMVSMYRVETFSVAMERVLREFEIDIFGSELNSR